MAVQVGAGMGAGVGVGQGPAVLLQLLAMQPSHVVQLQQAVCVGSRALAVQDLPGPA